MTDGWTNRPHCSVCNNRLHLHSTAGWPNNTKMCVLILRALCHLSPEVLANADASGKRLLTGNGEVVVILSVKVGKLL